MYELVRVSLSTPAGFPIHFDVRDDSSDYNTIRSCTIEDEYGLLDLDLQGVALDIGAHIGGVSISLLIDNEDLQVIAVEAIPENAALLRNNAKLNHVADRLTVINAAAAAPGVESMVINYGYELDTHHAWIGNITMLEGQGGAGGHREVRVPTISLGALTGRPVSLMKIDCEGGEYGFLSDAAALPKVARIVGEYHPLGPDPSGNGPKVQYRRSDLIRLLERTHVLTFPPVNADTDPEQGPGGFLAVRRG